MTPTRPIWAEISRHRLTRNFRLLRSLTGPESELLAVIKANAYGHGLADCARVLAAEGARWFGVTCLGEAVALRQVCPQQRILVMSGLWPGEAEASIEHSLTPVVWDSAHLDLLEAAARRRNAKPFPVHLEIDTGMSRQGVQLSHLDSLLARFSSASPLHLEGVMTHFHSPEDAAAVAAQVQAFAEAVHRIFRVGLQPAFLSAGSSADGLAHGSGTVTDLALHYGAQRILRPGLALYGYAPQPGTAPDLQPVLAWKARVSGLRDIEPGATVGYGATFAARHRTRLALLPVGYADGLNRLLSNRGAVLVRGHRAPVVGRISMDQTTVDVTGIPGVAPDDEVVILGQQEGERITAQDIADLTGTIPYEVLCAIAARVPRVPVE